MLPKIIRVLLVVCVVDVVGYRDEEPVDGGGSYGHYKEDANDEAEPLTTRRYVAKHTVKTLNPREIEAVKGAIKQILSGHKQDRLFSPMPSNENVEKRSLRDKRIDEPVTAESYDRYIRTKINQFTEQTDETTSESTSVSTNDPENDMSSTNEGTDENYETSEPNTKGPTRSSLPLRFNVHHLTPSTTDETTKESSQTDTNEELMGATEAIPTRSPTGTIGTDDTLSSTESSTKDYQTGTNEGLTGATEAIPIRTPPPIALTFQQTITYESRKEKYTIEANDFIRTMYKTDNSLSSTDESSSTENFQIGTSNQLVARTGPDSDTEEKGAEVKEAESEETEVKEAEPKETEVKEAESEETEVKEAESKETEVKEAESEETEVKEGEPKETGVKEIEEQKPEIYSKTEKSEVKESEVESDEAIDTKAPVSKRPKYIPKVTRTTESTTTTKRTTKFQLDVPALLEIIANLTYDYEMNLTDNLNETLLRLSIPTCETPTTTEKMGDFIDYDANATGTIVAKCFVCGLEEESIPRHAQCADAFAGDFIPLVPVDMTARGRISKYRKYCRYLDVPHYLVNSSMPRSVYGRWTGGCSVRWIDLSGIYTQRSCRNKDRAIMGRHFASKRMAKLEMALTSLKEGCIASPMATLVPLSRGISLYARFHACVCTGSWCNAAAVHTHWLVIVVVTYVGLLSYDELTLF